MWQIVWMLNLLPDWFFHTLLIICVLGIVASYILKRIPWVNTYNVPLRIVSTLLLLGVIWIEGGRDVQHAWEAKVAELEQKVKEAEERSQQVNVKIETKYRDRVKVVKEVQVEVQERIKEVEKRIDAECKLDPEVPRILNDAAANQKGIKK